MKEAPSTSGSSSKESFLFRPIDPLPLVYFRIVFGAVMLWEVWRYFSNDWIGKYYIEPSFHFTYFGFGWVHPWPGSGMYWHFLALAVLALFIMLGFFFRICAVLFFFGFSYVFLLEEARYLNHFYLIVLLSFVLMWIPAHCACSLDARRGVGVGLKPARGWHLWLLRFQLGIAYFYGGIAKLNGDWLKGEPMRKWLSDRTDFPIIGSYFTEEWMVFLLAYGGIFLDLLAVPLLLWRRTRWGMVGLLVCFHLMNDKLFTIGIFPYLMIAVTPLFFPLPWRCRFGLKGVFGSRVSAGAAWESKNCSLETGAASGYRKLVLGLLGVYALIQMAVPLRHYLYPGFVNWTEEGHKFAWHMKLRSKRGEVVYAVTESGRDEVWSVYPEDHLVDWQVRKMSIRPDMILTFAHYIALLEGEEEDRPVEVRAEAWCSLNGRDRELLVNPRIDLTGRSRSLAPADWIVPLTSPLTQDATSVLP